MKKLDVTQFPDIYPTKDNQGNINVLLLQVSYLYTCGKWNWNIWACSQFKFKTIQIGNNKIIYINNSYCLSIFTTYTCYGRNEQLSCVCGILLECDNSVAKVEDIK